MIDRLKNYGAKLFVALLSINVIETLIRYMVAACLNHLSPKEGLCFLFRLDGYLYDLEGTKAIEYDNGIHTKHRHMKYHDFFINRIRKEESILDIGCGNGAVTYRIAENTVSNVTGIDICKKNISIAKSRFAHERIQFITGNVMDEIPINHYDVVILSNILEHLTDRSNFLKKIQDNIRPNYFLIRVPLFERDWRVPLKKELNVEWRLDPTHKIEYTTESFKNEISAADLKIVHQEVRWCEIWAEVKSIDS